MATYGYTRVSTVEQSSGASLGEQRRKIKGVALIRGVALDSIFDDTGISGSTQLERRPDGARLMAQLREGDVLIVAKLDRAFRNAADALTKADAWRAHGIALIVADMGSDPVTDSGVAKLFFGMLALVAEFERGRILERTAEGRRSKADGGGHIGGSAPFGFRVEGKGRAARLVEIPEQQRALETIRELASKESLRSIGALVREQHGIAVSHEAIRRVVRAQ